MKIFPHPETLKGDDEMKVDAAERKQTEPKTRNELCRSTNFD